MADQQIVIDIQARTSQAMQKIKAMGKMMRAQTAAMATSMQGVQEQLQAIGRGQGFDMPDIRGKAEALEVFDSNAKSVNKNLNNIAAQGMITAEAMETMGNKGKKAGKGFSNSFDEAALGVLFFGMQLKNIATGIMRSATKTFNDVMHQIDGTTTQTDRLNGAFQFLKFAIGEALQPVVGFLVPIIIAMGKFVEEHESLVRIALIATAVFGQLAFLYGTFKLGIPAVIDAYKTMRVAAVKAFAPLAGLSAAAIGAILALAAIFVSLGVRLAQNEEMQKSWADNISGPVLESLGGLVESLGLTNENIDSFGEFLSLVIDYLAVFGAFLTDIVRILIIGIVEALTITIELLKAFGEIILNIGIAIWEFGSGIGQVAKDLVDVFGPAVSAVTKALRALKMVFTNPVKAKNLLSEAKDDFSSFTSEVENFDFGGSFMSGFDTSSFFDLSNEIMGMADSKGRILDALNFQFTGDTIRALRESNRATAMAESDTRESTQQQMLQEQKTTNEFLRQNAVTQDIQRRSAQENDVDSIMTQFGATQ